MYKIDISLGRADRLIDGEVSRAIETHTPFAQDLRYAELSRTLHALATGETDFTIIDFSPPDAVAQSGTRKTDAKVELAKSEAPRTESTVVFRSKIEPHSPRFGVEVALVERQDRSRGGIVRKEPFEVARIRFISVSEDEVLTKGGIGTSEVILNRNNAILHRYAPVKHGNLVLMRDRVHSLASFASAARRLSR